MGTFASLRLPNYRWYFTGTTVSSIGMWIARTAQTWLVLQVTGNSGMKTAVLSAIMFAPAILLAPWAGAIADRFDKRMLMTLAGIVMIVDSVLLGAMAVTGHATLLLIYVITFVDGVAGAVDGPARMVFITEVVDRDYLNNAISMGSMSFNGARLAGPFMAGFLIVSFGTGRLFFVNAFTYAFFLVTLWMMRTGDLHLSPKTGKGSGRIREGFAYVRQRSDIMMLMFLAFVMATFGMNFAFTNGMMNNTIFHRDADSYGIMNAAMAVGAMAAALVNARRERTRVRHLVFALGGSVVVTVLGGLTNSYWFFVAMLVPAGFAAITVLVGCNALVQMSVDPAVRGRVMALYSAVLLGGTPLFSPLLGYIGDAWGPRWTVLLGAILCGLGALAATAYLVKTKDIHLRLDWRPRSGFVVVEYANSPAPAAERIA